MSTSAPSRDGLSAEALEADETLRRAVARSLEVIGEAAKKLPRISAPAILMWSGER